MTPTRSIYGFTFFKEVDTCKYASSAGTAVISALASRLVDRLVPATSLCGPDLSAAIHALSATTNAAQIIAAFPVFPAPFSPQMLLKYSPFPLPDCWQHLPKYPSRRLPSWPSQGCTMASLRNVLWEQCWLWKLLGTWLPSHGSAELTCIPGGFQWFWIAGLLQLGAVLPENSGDFQEKGRCGAEGHGLGAQWQWVDSWTPLS